MGELNKTALSITSTLDGYFGLAYHDGSQHGARVMPPQPSPVSSPKSTAGTQQEANFQIRQT